MLLHDMAGIPLYRINTMFTQSVNNFIYKTILNYGMLLIDTAASKIT